MVDLREIETIVLSPEGSSCDEDPDIIWIDRPDNLSAPRVTKDSTDKDNRCSDLYPKDCLGNEDVEVLRPNNIYAYSPTQHSVQEIKNIILDENENYKLASNEYSVRFTNKNVKNSVPDINNKIKIYEISDDDDDYLKPLSLNNVKASKINNAEQDEKNYDLSDDVIIIDEENSPETVILNETACNTGNAKRRINVHEITKYNKNDKKVVDEERTKKECYASPISLDSNHEELEKKDSTCIAIKSPWHTEGSHLEFPDYEDDHISCEFCSKIFKTMIGLTLHECIKKKQSEYFNNNVHKFEAPFKKRRWQNSEKTFSWSSDHDQDFLTCAQPKKRRCHIKPIQRDQKYVAGKDDQIYNCHLCEYTIRGRENLRFHVHQHRIIRDTRLYCLYCDKAFRMKKDLRRHTIATHQSKKVDDQKYTLNLCETILNTKNKRAKQMTEHDTVVVEETLVLNRNEEKIPLRKSSEVDKLQITKPIQSSIVTNTKDSAEVSQSPLVSTTEESLLNVNVNRNDEEAKVMNMPPMIGQREKMSVESIAPKLPQIILEEDALEDVGLNESNQTSNEIKNMESHADMDIIEVTPLNDNNIEVVTTNIVNMNVSLPKNIEKVDFKQTRIVEETSLLDGFDLNNFIDNLEQSALPNANEKADIDEAANTLAEFDLSYLDGTNDCAGDNESSTVMCSDPNQTFTDNTTLSFPLMKEQDSGNEMDCGSQTVVSDPGNIDKESVYYQDLLKFMEKTSDEIRASMSKHKVPGFENETEFTKHKTGIPTEVTASNTSSEPYSGVQADLQNTENCKILHILVRPFPNKSVQYVLLPTQDAVPDNCSEPSAMVIDEQNIQQDEINKQIVHNIDHSGQSVQHDLLQAQEPILSMQYSKEQGLNKHITQQINIKNKIFARPLPNKVNISKPIQGRNKEVSRSLLNVTDTTVPVQSILLEAQDTSSHKYSEPSSNVKSNNKEPEQNTEIVYFNQSTKEFDNQDAVVLALQNEIHTGQQILLPGLDTTFNAYNEPTGKIEVTEQNYQINHINQGAVEFAFNNEVNTSPDQLILSPTPAMDISGAHTLDVEQKTQNHYKNQETDEFTLNNKIDTNSAQCIMCPAQDICINILRENDLTSENDQNAVQNEVDTNSAQSIMWSAENPTVNILTTPTSEFELALNNKVDINFAQFNVLPSQETRPGRNFGNRTMNVLDINQYELNGASEVSEESVASSKIVHYGTSV